VRRSHSAESRQVDMRRSWMIGDSAPRLVQRTGTFLHRLGSAWDAFCGPDSSGDELLSIAERERAFCRVATLVAKGASPSAVFGQVCGEVAGLVQADFAGIMRCECGRTLSVVAAWSGPDAGNLDIPFGGRWVAEDETPAAIALRTGRPARRSTASLTGGIGEWARAQGIGYGVACPITVNGAPWGVVTALYREAAPRPDAEERMADFGQLLNCAIAQAEARAELIGSQLRFVTASDAVRHRIERDLHDGPQQRLVTLGIQLREAENMVTLAGGRLRECLAEVAEGLTEVNNEIRGLCGGLRPVALARGGLPAAIKSLVRRCPVPVELNLDADQPLSEHLELTIFYVVSEALTNVLKHALAETVHIDLTTDGVQTWLNVTDDGVGGAASSRGSGLLGLQERVKAVGGDFHIVSPVSGGTSLSVTLPNLQERRPD
jgi:signal transduction histidine kinase